MADNNPNPKATLSQEEQIKRWFLDHPDMRITSYDALVMFDTLEFPKRISTLRRNGLPIDCSEWRKTRTGKNIKAYFLPKEAAEQYKQSQLQLPKWKR